MFYVHKNATVTKEVTKEGRTGAVMLQDLFHSSFCKFLTKACHCPMYLVPGKYVFLAGVLKAAEFSF